MGCSSYALVDAGGKTVAFIGITTPETMTSSTPAYFQNEAGDYIYDILGGADGEALYLTVQKAIDDAEDAGADYDLHFELNIVISARRLYLPRTYEMKGVMPAACVPAV